MHLLSVLVSVPECFKHYSFILQFILNRGYYYVFVDLFLVPLPESNFHEVEMLSFLLAVGLLAHGRGSIALCSQSGFPVLLISPSQLLPSYQYLSKFFH